MSRRQPSYARRRLRSDLRRFLRSNALILAGFICIVCASVVPTFWLVDGYLRGLLHGIAVTSAVFAVWQLFLVHGGHMFRLSGVWGEDNTRDVLRGAKRRGTIYGWVDNLEIEGGDVDHLGVAPWGIVAIDSKWHGVGLNDSTIGRACERALAATRRARLILRSEGYPTDVSTVVAIWDAKQERIPSGGVNVDGVTLFRGSDLKRWLRSRRVDPEMYSPSIAGGLLSQLTRFRTRVRPN